MRRALSPETLSRWFRGKPTQGEKQRTKRRFLPAAEFAGNVEGNNHGETFTLGLQDSVDNQAARTEDRNFAASAFRRLLSPDSICADERT
jgi:hypothetical protein